MDKEKSENGEKENIELRIGEMKQQFQKSYEIFMKANAELSKLSFESLLLQEKDFGSAAISNLKTKEVDEILTADSIDDSIKLLRTKIDKDEGNSKTSFPDVAKLINIMNNLRFEIDGMKEKQDSFAKLASDVNEEMNRFERELELTATHLSELTGEHSDEEYGEDADDEISDSFANQDDDNEKFDSDFLSD